MMDKRKLLKLVVLAFGVSILLLSLGILTGLRLLMSIRYDMYWNKNHINTRSGLKPSITRGDRSITAI